MGANGAILNFVFDVFSILILFRSQIRRSAKNAKSRLAELRLKFQTVKTKFIFNFSEIENFDHPWLFKENFI